jgi:pyruvate dehydrogenase E1 component
MDVPSYDDYRPIVDRDNGKEISTTQGFVRILSRLCKDKLIGKNIVPIVPDESRTFGMEGMFREVGIYANAGQLYEPVDSDQLAYYKEAKDGQLLEEGISECGSISSFCAAGSAYASHGVNMIPFYIFYSMFGFQRIGDSIWAGADLRVKGFLIGGTAGRTTLNGEGLQHQDGNSLLYAMAYPTVRAYDPAFHYEMAVVIFDGLKKLYVQGETAIYYLMAGNENYVMPEMPAGVEEQIVKGMYKFRSAEVSGAKHRVQLFGSGAIMNCVLDGQKILADKFNIASDVWSVTSYTELRRDAQEVRRLNMLNPGKKPKKSFVEQQLEGHEGPIIAASDYVRAVSEQVAPWMPAPFLALGTDGMGRSETRESLRRHFEVDAEFVALGALWQLAQQKQIDFKVVEKAIKTLGINPEKASPLYA